MSKYQNTEFNSKLTKVVKPCDVKIVIIKYFNHVTQVCHTKLSVMFKTDHMIS